MTEGRFGPEQVNVRDQPRDPDSLLNWFRRLVDGYRECPELAWGAYTVLDPGPEARPVLAHRCDADGGPSLALHNFADAEGRGGAAAARAGRDGADRRARTRRGGGAGGQGRPDHAIPLPAYGCRWLRSGG